MATRRDTGKKAGQKTVKKAGKKTGRKPVKKKTTTAKRSGAAGGKPVRRKKGPPRKSRVTDPGRRLTAHDPTESVSEGVRLNKYLADHGIASRRRCDELIAEGKVTVDGVPVTELGIKVDPSVQQVEVSGVVLRPERTRRRYYLLNKPPGVVCTNEQRETRPRAIDLVTDPEKGRIYTVGRLDEDSKGLIVLTNDGELANRVMHPRHGVPKTYVVKLQGKIDDEALGKVRDGVRLSEGKTSGMRIVVKKRSPTTSLLAVTLREGMNREIRRAFARVGFKVTDLRRTRIGPLDDRGLKTGHWRPLLAVEVRALVDWSEGRQPEAEPEAPRGRRGSSRAGGAPAPGRRGPQRKAAPGGARSAKRTSGPAPKRSGERSTERSGDAARSAQRPTKRVADRTAKRPADRSPKRTAKRAADRTAKGTGSAKRTAKRAGGSSRGPKRADGGRRGQR